jgi:hypothetical protein
LDARRITGASIRQNIGPDGCRTIVSLSNCLMAGKTPPDGTLGRTMKPRSHALALFFATSRGSTIARAYRGLIQSSFAPFTCCLFDFRFYKMLKLKAS